MIEEKNENQETEEIEKVEPESEEIETPIDEVTSEEITQSRFGPEDLEAAIKTRDRKALLEIFETFLTPISLKPPKRSTSKSLLPYLGTRSHQ